MCARDPLPTPSDSGVFETSMKTVAKCAREHRVSQVEPGPGFIR